MQKIQKTKGPENFSVSRVFLGGSPEDRTPDPLIKSQVLYHLS